MAGKKVVIVGEVYDPTLGIGGGPIFGGGGEGIWGPTDPRPTPPIYIPVPPPEGGGGEPGVPAHPIYIPVYPTHPIVIPLPPTDAHPEHPIALPPVVWPPLPPLGIWGPTDPRPTPPIYIPIEPPPPEGGGEPGVPTHPIFFPVYPSHPIVLPPEGEHPKPPPDMINPPSGARGFWGYSVYYQSMVFVPYEGAFQPGGGAETPPNPDAPHVEPHSGGRRRG